MSNNLPKTPTTPDSGRWKPVQRAYPTGTEVLTEHGWINMATFFDTKYLGSPVPFDGNGRNLPGYPMKELEWGQWEPNPHMFPKVASVDPVTGKVVFTTPTRFMYYRYDGRLIHIKMKGIDFLCTAFTDLWVHPKYGRQWKYVLADDVVRSNYGTFNFGLINKWSEDLYGMFVPEINSSFEQVSGVDVFTSNIVGSMDAPIRLHPKKHASRKRVWDIYNYDTFDEDGRIVEADVRRMDVETFNIVVPPYHNIIIRRARKDENPRTLWVGSPVVVGDGLDKSLLRVNKVLNGGPHSVGGSYSTLRNK